MPIYEIQLRGRVQGVGFRYHALKSAKLLGVKGYVRNLPDRSVYILAEADETIINSFCELLRRGNGFSRVDGLSKEMIHSTNRYNEFEIR